MKKSLFLIFATCLMLSSCFGSRDGKQKTAPENKLPKGTCAINNDSYYRHEIELTIVNRIPRGTWAANNEQNDTNGFGWYDIGLSRNGKEPVEFIWRPALDSHSYVIEMADIGNSGIVRLNSWATINGFRLPPPNSSNPPVLGLLGEVHWLKLD